MENPQNPCVTGACNDPESEECSEAGQVYCDNFPDDPGCASACKFDSNNPDNPCASDACNDPNSQACADVSMQYCQNYPDDPGCEGQETEGCKFTLDVPENPCLNNGPCAGGNASSGACAEASMLYCTLHPSDPECGDEGGGGSGCQFDLTNPESPCVTGVCLGASAESQECADASTAYCAKYPEDPACGEAGGGDDQCSFSQSVAAVNPCNYQGCIDDWAGDDCETFTMGYCAANCALDQACIDFNYCSL